MSPVSNVFVLFCIGLQWCCVYVSNVVFNYKTRRYVSYFPVEKMESDLQITAMPLMEINVICTSYRKPLCQCLCLVLCLFWLAVRSS